MKHHLKAGDTVHVGEACGVPHGFRPINFRITRIDASPGWQGMRWLEGYELDTAGDATEHRKIYVRVAGLQLLTRHTGAPDRRTTRRWVSATSAIAADEKRAAS